MVISINNLSRFFRTIKFGLVFCNLAILFFSVVFIIFYMQKSSNEVLTETAKTYMSMSNAGASQDIRDLFKRFETLAKSGGAIFADYESAEGVSEIAVKVMAQYLEESPYLTGVLFGKEDGFYLYSYRRNDADGYKKAPTKKLPQGTAYAWKTIMNVPEGRREVIHYFNNNFTELDQETSLDNDFDPRTRPWYNSVKNENIPKWTDIYFFKGQIREPGITVSCGVIPEKTRKTVGVFGFDIGLSRLKEMLISNKSTQNSSLHIVGPSGEIISTTLDLKSKYDKDSNLVLSNISDEGLEDLKKVFESKFSSSDINIYTNNAGVSYLYDISDMSVGNIKWKLISITPTEDLLGPIKQRRVTAFLLCLGILALASFIMFIFTKRISHLIAKLSESASDIENFRLEKAITTPSSILEIKNLSHAMDSMRCSMSSFSKYVPKDLVLKLMKEGNLSEISGSTKEVTLMFTDIVNFTHISESLKPNDLIEQVSEYFEMMTQVILDHRGNVDKYIGDAIMSFWGAPELNPRHPSDACYSGLLMQRILRTKNSDWINLGQPPFATRIGIHTGSAVVGNIGSQLRMNYTAIGDMVNLASRLEGLNKYYQTEILISGDTYAKVHMDFLARPLGKVAVKGKDSFVSLYELVGGLRHVDSQLLLSPSKMKDYEKYRVAYDYFEERRFQQALDIFMDIDEKDGPVSMMIEECKKLCKSPPDENWKGLIKVMGEK